MKFICIALLALGVLVSASQSVEEEYESSGSSIYADQGDSEFFANYYDDQEF